MADPQIYKQMERARACRWKHMTETLSPQAKQPGLYRGAFYDFCLPSEYAALSLLPEIRDMASALFVELGIPWHEGIGNGPGNHLLSSQVQCVNALGQMVNDAERLIAAFGKLLGTVEVMEIEPGRLLTFEYIGARDYFNEATGGQRVRGSMCTSVDAAFVHRNVEGFVELVLVEWKYTESYDSRAPEPDKDAIRLQRYGTAWAAADGPVRCDVLEFSDLLNEPFYQLMRQQLLAHELEKDHAHGADRVRIVHVLSDRNIAYQQSLLPAHSVLGGSVSEVWQQLLHTPDRFVHIDSSVFLDPAVTSHEYASRYGEPLTRDQMDALLPEVATPRISTTVVSESLP